MTKMNERHKILDNQSFAVARAISRQTGLQYRGQMIYNQGKPLSHLACHINNLTPPCQTMNTCAKRKAGLDCFKNRLIRSKHPQRLQTDKSY